MRSDFFGGRGFVLEEGDLSCKVGWGEIFAAWDGFVLE